MFKMLEIVKGTNPFDDFVFKVSYPPVSVDQPHTANDGKNC